MQMYSLNRRLRNTNITVTSCHPGMIDTRIGAELSDHKVYQLLVTMGRATGLIKTALHGATTVINCAVSPDVEGGVYYKDCKPARTASVARDGTKQEQLWNITLEFLKGHLTEEEVYCLEGADPK